MRYWVEENKKSYYQRTIVSENRKIRLWDQYTDNREHKLYKENNDKTLEVWGLSPGPRLLAGLLVTDEHTDKQAYGKCHKCIF